VTAAATWHSSDPRIATVSPGGEVTAVRVGTVEITGTYNGLSGSFRFSVQPVSCC
jgi:uncharacterized protein YjdB